MDHKKHAEGDEEPACATSDVFAGAECYSLAGKLPVAPPPGVHDCLSIVSTKGGVTMSEISQKNEGETMLQSAIALSPKIKACTEEIERERRLPMHLIQAMKDAHIFGMAMPRAWGGPELDPITQIRVIEALSVADASVGWCAMIGVDGGYMTGFLDQTVAREMYPDIDVPTAFAASPTGRAVPVEGGYRVSGRWPFASGCHNAEWMIAGCIVSDGEGPPVGADGIPKTRQCFLPASDCQILDTWYTTGLRGTGSTDFAVQDCFVPAERTFSLQEVSFHREGPLYRFPFNFLFKFAAPPLGVARAAIDALIEAAAQRPSRPTSIGDQVAPARLLRDEAYVQDAVGKAEALLGSARSYLFDVRGDIWATLVKHETPTPRQLAQFTMVNPQVFSHCCQAVELVYKARGGSAVYANGPLDRCLRDVLNTLKSYAMAGRMLLGLPPEIFLL